MKITKKSSAEQIPQSKVIIIIGVQVNKLLVASQEVVSWKPKCWELGVYHIASCYPTSLRVASQRAYELPTFKLTIFKAAGQPE